MAKLNLERCPACGEQSFVVSIFGSICQRCFFNPATDEPASEDKEVRRYACSYCNSNSHIWLTCESRSNGKDLEEVRG